MPKGINLDSVEIWFQDESRIGEQNTTTRLWGVKGTRPRAIKQQQFEYLYFFGAVCPKNEKSVGLVMPYVNTFAMEKHLSEISKKVSKNNCAVIILDRAAWHTTKKINIPENVFLLFLPPYSPELNPMEQMWQNLRDKYLANRCFSGYDDILQSCCEAWNDFVNKKGKVKKLCSRKWAFLGS